MPDFRWIDPAYSELLGRHGLDELRSVMGRRDGQHLTGDRKGRDGVRLDLYTGDGPPLCVTLKRECNARPKDVLGQLWASGGVRTSCRWEWQTLRRLDEAGLEGLRPLACFERGAWPSRGCLILEEPADALPLGLHLAKTASGDETNREGLFALLGQSIARLHAAGCDHPDLYSNHLLIAGEIGAERIVFRDLHNSRRLPAVPLARRAQNLGALLATLPRRLAGGQDRQHLLDAYLAHSELEERGIEILAAIERQVELQLTRRRIWEIRESDTAEHQAVQSLVAVDAGAMWVNREFRASLDSAGLNRFKSIMATTGGRLLRALPDRENWRLELHAPHGAAQGAYLKKHHVRDARSWWRAKVGAGPGKSAGRVEARNAARLARSGIAAMRLIAYGEKLHADGLLESFVLTEELTGFTQLDHFLRQRFAPRAERDHRPRDKRLARLLRDVADVAARFHRLGYNHRDLYCCHFFISEPAAAEFKIHLIDLQRVEHRRRRRWRWLVKDLAQLAYSAPRDRVSCTDRMAFVKHYLGVAKLRPQDKRLVRQVLAKQRWMEWSHGKHP